MSDDVIKYSSDNQEVVSRAALPEDQEPEILSLRPERLSVYVGQEEVVETLKIAIQAATERGEPIDHVLFHGPPGLGKTTLAHIIANEMQGNLTVTSGPALEKGGLFSKRPGRDEIANPVGAPPRRVASRYAVPRGTRFHELPTGAAAMCSLLVNGGVSGGPVA